ncbi:MULTISPECIES: hypothetical protein [Actinoalloteichus]|uniref:Uncharacterized protein n=1 Tax=Actinoalloteichus fjordicus TaxID=1612552 RepID=A0AAC9LF56_9PSEU|nr:MULTISPECIES: hypothetical protein [Actinoalloteichus]APU15720.1 hypothetical protein UA74_18460 [Actinoalloteichus fjordicus]APU21780.1 hypothetical protein UA75_18950 [Actinoalloteichus sp. GBA129-24]
MSAWFVRSLDHGDTHLGDPEDSAVVRPAPAVAPRCAPDAPFHPMNRRPMDFCFFEWQMCRDCLAVVGRPRDLRPLLAVAG